MRTTVDLPPAVHRRVSELAAERGASMSATIAALTGEALERTDRDRRPGVSPLTGLPLFSSGRTISNDEVLAFLEEDE